MTVRRLEALELGEVLGSLLGAIVDAQTEATRSSLAFVEAIGFGPSDPADPAAGDRLRTVTLRYTKLDENNQPAEFTAEVPLLALVNIPTLAVGTATIKLSYDVLYATSSTEESAGDTTTSGDRLRALAGRTPAVLRGLVNRRTTTTTSSQTTASIDVDVTIERDELPVGLERLLDMAELSIRDSKS